MGNDVHLIKWGYARVADGRKYTVDADGLYERRVGERLPAGGGLVRHIGGDGSEDGFSFGMDVEDATDEYESAARQEDGADDSEDGYIDVDEILAEAQAEIDEMRAKAEAQIEADRHQAMDAARSDGYREGYANGMAETQSERDALAQEKLSLEREYDDLVDSLEPRFVDTLCDIYQYIVGVDLSNYRDVVMHLAAKTLRKSEGGGAYIVHVSEEDYEYVSSHKDELALNASAASALEVVEDLTLGKGDALIENDGGLFDCSIGTQMEELGKRLRLLSLNPGAGA